MINLPTYGKGTRYEVDGTDGFSLCAATTDGGVMRFEPVA